MLIRIAKSDDIDRIKMIHEKYHDKDFPLNELQEIAHNFVVVNDENDIIVFGGIRYIAEIVAVTDLSYNIRDRREALFKLLEVVKFEASGRNFKRIHVFPTVGSKNYNSDTWIKGLEKVGFSRTINDCYFLNLE